MYNIRKALVNHVSNIRKALVKHVAILEKHMFKRNCIRLTKERYLPKTPKESIRSPKECSYKPRVVPDYRWLRRGGGFRGIPEVLMHEV